MATIFSLKTKTIFLFLAIFFVGILLGGYLFSDTRTRSFLAFHECKNTCLEPQELTGLAASVGIQRFSNLIPFVVKETEKTIAIRHPFPRADVHFVIIPKKDIPNAGEISDEDGEYLLDAYAVMSSLIKEKNLKKYKIVTNGPRYQTIGYLHFHLVSLEQ
ncbi:MAG: HIT domain-containing protein [Patescibacteria group bacterium]